MAYRTLRSKSKMVALKRPFRNSRASDAPGRFGRSRTVLLKLNFPRRRKSLGLDGERSVVLLAGENFVSVSSLNVPVATFRLARPKARRAIGSSRWRGCERGDGRSDRRLALLGREWSAVPKPQMHRGLPLCWAEFAEGCAAPSDVQAALHLFTIVEIDESVAWTASRVAREDRDRY